MHSESGLVFAPNTKPQRVAGKRLPELFREAARFVAGGGSVMSSFVDQCGESDWGAPMKLWNSFRDHIYYESREETVLGLLLLAEVLETAE